MKQLFLIGIIALVFVSACSQGDLGQAETMEGEIAVVEEWRQQVKEEAVVEEPAINLTCYNNTFSRYLGEINDTCYFFGCRDKCELRELNQCFELYNDGKYDRGCVYDYFDCVEGCSKDIDHSTLNIFDAHEWLCIINETVEETTEERCY